jgi:hypothetical protein
MVLLSSSFSAIKFLLDVKIGRNSRLTTGSAPSVNGPGEFFREAILDFELDEYYFQ